MCDVIALQECEHEDEYVELKDSHCLFASVAAKDSRGFVQIYVRKGITADVVDMIAGDPSVAVRLTLDTPLGKKESLAVVAVHLPTGHAFSGLRARVLTRVQAKVGEFDERWMVVGDFNPSTDEEIEILCKTLNLKDARYAGVSWNAPGNLFYDGNRKNPGKRLDRVLFSRRVWAETHLVGQGKICLLYTSDAADE